MLVAVAPVADVDIVVLTNTDAAAVDDMTRELPGVHVVAARPTRKPTTLANLARCVTQRRTPAAVWFRDVSSVAGALDEWAHNSYDLVWDACPLASDLLESRRLGPVIVDRYDLEEEWIRGRIRAEQLWRRPWRLARARFDLSRWTAFSDERARRAAYVLVCSETDRARLSGTNVLVVPNGYERPVEPVGRHSVGEPPTLLFQGQMTYEPNVDAAVHFVEHVFPRIRAVHPEVQLRIVGRCDDAVARLGSQTNVTVTGYVPLIEDELARSDVVIVPMRFGSGTRIKLLEAFAHRIPAVSTTLGAEGLDVVDGTHLLLADDDEAFASACVRLVRDLELRRTLVNEAERLYLAHYQWSQIHATVADVVHLVTSDAVKPEP